MTTATNVQNLRQHKNKVFFDCRADSGFTSGTNLIREIKNLAPNFKQIT